MLRVQVIAYTAALIVLIVTYYALSSGRHFPRSGDKEKATAKRPVVHLLVVACDDRFNESIVMLKSTTLFTRVYFHVHIFADDKLRPVFEEQLNAWPDEVRARFSYATYPIQYPANQDAAEWKKLFKVCASQRLFFPDLLKDVDSLLYVDTDVLFLRPLEDLWRFFARFNSTQIAGMAPECENGTASWYNHSVQHPYVPPNGVNSGVMLMNMTRMRQAGWLQHIVRYYKKYRDKIRLGDQDLINIFFHYFPEKLFLVACHFNYRMDHCAYKSNCESAEKEGVSVLHGNRYVYHNEFQPAFKAVYQAVRDYKFGESLQAVLLPNIAKKLRESAPSQCGKTSHIFTKQLERQVQRRVNKEAPND